MGSLQEVQSLIAQHPAMADPVFAMTLLPVGIVEQQEFGFQHSEPRTR